MSEETGTTTAAQRFGVVMSWIQAIAIIVGLSVSLLLFVIAGYEGWEDDLLLFAAIWGVGGCLLGLLLAAIAYIVSGRFSILPTSHLQLTNRLIVGTPLAVGVAAVVIVEMQSVKAPPSPIVSSSKLQSPDMLTYGPRGNLSWSFVDNRRDVQYAESQSAGLGYLRKVKTLDHVVLGFFPKSGGFSARAYWKAPCIKDSVIKTSQEYSSGEAIPLRCQEWGGDTWLYAGVNWSERDSALYWLEDYDGFEVNEDFNQWDWSKAKQYTTLQNAETPEERRQREADAKAAAEERQRLEAQAAKLEEERLARVAKEAEEERVRREEAKRVREVEKAEEERKREAEAKAAKERQRDEAERRLSESPLRFKIDKCPSTSQQMTDAVRSALETGDVELYRWLATCPTLD